LRTTRVVLAAAHLDSDPSNNRLRNLRALCQRCHLQHDRPHHLAQRRITYRRRWAIGDLFLGRYDASAGLSAWPRWPTRNGRGCAPASTRAGCSPVLPSDAR